MRLPPPEVHGACCDRAIIFTYMYVLLLMILMHVVASPPLTQDDSASRAVTAALQPVVSQLAGPLTVWQDRRLLGLIVFNVAMWRKFGTASFIKACGWLSLDSWSEAIVRLVEAARHCRGHAFTTAYGPSRVYHHVECSAMDETQFGKFLQDAGDDMFCCSPGFRLGVAARFFGILSPL